MSCLQMLKYQVRSSGSLHGSATALKTSTNSLDRPSSSVCSSQETLPVRNRSNSLSSLSSIDSSDSTEWGVLKVYTGCVNEDTEYKTLRISTSHTAKNVIDTIIGKFRISYRDPNLFEIVMEVRTRIRDCEVKNLLLLSPDSRPLELQRCHPADMSRFFLVVSRNGILVRIYDYLINPQSNYKSLILSTRTTCYETIALLLAVIRREGSPNDYRLSLSEAEHDLDMSDTIADLYVALDSQQKILIRRIC
uniref:Ras-associating domain-containing protein n=1 Tax=Parascaris univalens TaxID=6257 RepID=A0A915B488_PARUN